MFHHFPNTENRVKIFEFVKTPGRVLSMIFTVFNQLIVTKEKDENKFKTESIRKLSYFSFQWTKTLYQNNTNNFTFFFFF